jgi:serine/threonine protein phosphatase 1
MPALLTYAVGDIHGSYTKMKNLLSHCRDHCGQKVSRIVFLGDYVDRGRRSRDVVSHLIKMQAEAPEQIVCLRGNHEEMLLDAARTGDERQWRGNGADATLASYGAGTAAELPPDHLKWFAALPLSISDEKRFFVHAGIRPGVPLKKQAKDDMLWIREQFLDDPRPHGQYIVHGHTPIEAMTPELRRNRLNLDTGACFGGPLTAAVFEDTTAGPKAFITDDGTIVRAPALNALEEA